MPFNCLTKIVSLPERLHGIVNIGLVNKIPGDGDGHVQVLHAVR